MSPAITRAVVSWPNWRDKTVPHLGRVITVLGEPVTSQRLPTLPVDSLDELPTLPLTAGMFLECEHTLVMPLFAAPDAEPVWVPSSLLSPVPSRKERGES